MLIKLRILVSLYLCLLVYSGYAQPTFQMHYGGSSEDISQAIIQTSDGGYLLVGLTYFGQGVWDIGLIRTNAVGDIVWSKAYGKSESDYPGGVIETFDGGYALTGFVYNGSDYDLLFMKTDQAGNIQIDKLYVGIGNEQAKEIIQLPDSTYLITGSESPSPGNVNSFAMRIDQSGNIIWSKKYGTNGKEWTTDICSTSDGNFLLTGATQSFGNGRDDPLVIKITPNGDTLWTRVLVDYEWSEIYDVIEGPDTNYYMVGVTGPPTKAYLAKLNPSGDTLYSRSYIGGSWLYGVTVDTLRGEILLGVSFDNIIINLPREAAIMRLKLNGDTIANHRYGSTDAFGLQMYDFVTTNDGGLAIAAYPVFLKDMYIIKADSSMISGCFDSTFSATYSDIAPIVKSGLNVNNYNVSAINANLVTTNTNHTHDTVCLTCPIAIVNSQINLSCVDSVGTIDLTPIAGLSPFTYNWSTGATTEDIANLSAGTYTVTVTDNAGCFLISSFTITGPTQLQSSHSKTDILCNGGSDGSIDLIVTGGSPPYSFDWSSGATTEDLASLGTGTYIVTVTDTCGVVVIDTAVIIEPALFEITSIGGYSNPCYGENNGGVAVWLAGGTLPYTYQWSTGDTTWDAQNLYQGTYYVTVSDSCGVVFMDSATIVDDPEIIISGFSSPSACNDSNGTAWVTVAGGVWPYLYDWPSNSNDTLYNIPAGIYTITITDFVGCTKIGSVPVSDFGGPTVSTSHTDVQCYGQCNGSASAFASGGATPYTYLWNDGNSQTTSGAGGLCATSYGVLVTGSDGCIGASTVTITQPNPLSVYIAEVFGSNCSGTATAYPLGGVSPYSYQWSANSGSQTTQTATGLCELTYCVTVTDANGCNENECVSIVSINQNVSSFYVKIYPNPGTGLFYINTQQSAELDVTVFNLSGEQVRANYHNGQLDISHQPNGIYFVRLAIGDTIINRKIILSR